MEDRLSRLEGTYEHLATKADVAELKADMAALKAELIKWMAGWTLGGMVAISTIVVTMLTFLAD